MAPPTLRTAKSLARATLQTAAKLPQTASILPLFGLEGLGTFFAGLIARFRR
jgi:hypothetical protein